MSVDVDHIVVSDKFKGNNEGFKHFVGYLQGGIVKPLCIILPQMSGYIKYFETGVKTSLFLLKMMKCGIDMMIFVMWLKIN